jgi:hypothetical protein
VHLDLRSVFSLELGHTDVLDSFISNRLFEAGVWESPPTSDGIVSLRVVTCEANCLSVCGRIFEIDQTLHSFWLDLTCEGSANGVSWAVYFDPIAGSQRCERNAIDTYDRAEDLIWRVALSGLADVRDGALVPASRDAVP